MKPTFNCKRGFTLIELLIAIIIIAILSTAFIALLNPLEQIKKTRDSQRKHDFDQLRKALEIYFIENDSYPLEVSGKMQVVQVGGLPVVKDWGDPFLPYVNKLPKDPLSTQTYCYESDTEGTYYHLYAKLEKDPTAPLAGTTCMGYNYSVNSPNVVAIAVAPTPTPTPPPPPPTSTPIPPTPTPTPTSTPTLKRVFVTSTSYDGKLGGLTGGDAKCKSVADGPSSLVQGKTWTAWLSTSAEDAVDRVYPPGAGKDNTEYRLVNDTTVADNKEDLIDGTIDTSIDKDESNNVVFGGAWTGTKTNGTVRITAGFPKNCEDWTAKIAEGGYGTIGAVNALWTERDDIWCGGPPAPALKLYCFEQ